MKTLFPVLALLILPVLPAQDESAAAAAMPDPRHEQHAVLKAMAGDWKLVTRTEAMPGVPDMEEATETEGSEHAELICNGLWLQSVIRGECGGQPFEGLWLAGYDPFEKKYVGIWVESSQPEHGVIEFEGHYDEESATVTWTGDTPHGPVRSAYAFEGPDRIVETCYIEGPDGEETKCMEVVRTRAEAPVASEAAAVTTADLPAATQRLLGDVGTWKATVESTAPGQEPVIEQGTERVKALCNGHWLWTDFEGRMMGMPYEGHGLYGWDASRKEYVSYWIDSMSATAARTTGRFDDGIMKLEGSCLDPFGTEMKIRQELAHEGEDERICRMSFESPTGTHRMKITYERAAKD